MPFQIRFLTIISETFQFNLKFFTLLLFFIRFDKFITFSLWPKFETSWEKFTNSYK